MHLLTAQKGEVLADGGAVDLGQTPADVLFLTSTDTEIAGMVAAVSRANSKTFSVRIANITQLQHPYSVDLYIEQTAAHAKLIVLRLLGGEGYWSYGLDELKRLCASRNIKFAVMPGCANPDPSLVTNSNLPREEVELLWQMLVAGGAANYNGALEMLQYWLADEELSVPKIAPTLPNWGVIDPVNGTFKEDHVEESLNLAGKHSVVIVFYRALMQADDLSPILALAKELKSGFHIDVIPVFVSSLKNRNIQIEVSRFLKMLQPSVIVSTMAFSVSGTGEDKPFAVLEAAGSIVLQVVLSGLGFNQWQQSMRGLSARDLAMHVALPELDGRVFCGVISFKSGEEMEPRTQCRVIRHAPFNDGISLVAEKIYRWQKLKTLAPSKKKIAFVVSDYPGHEGGCAHGVGLDTLASLRSIAHHLLKAGYGGADQILTVNLEQTILNLSQGLEGVELPKDIYLDWMRDHPDLMCQVLSVWGPLENDMLYNNKTNSIRLPIWLAEHLAICIQPHRSLKGSLKSDYHDQSKPPTHSYIAFYLWLNRGGERQKGKLHGHFNAIVHFGKHGTLEWLPGKALGLSRECFPEFLLGGMPNIYPFVVNDPGEGTQAKRRTQAVIIDHLTPPLTLAENGKAFLEIEGLVDEYFEASQLDPRRMKFLGDEILSSLRLNHLEESCGISSQDNRETALEKLDTFLCDLKELQITSGLHVFGEIPKGEKQNDLILCYLLGLLVPFESAEGNEVIDVLEALVRDLGLQTLTGHSLEEVWHGPKPKILTDLSECPWRNYGDTRERCRLLLKKCIENPDLVDAQWHLTSIFLDISKKRIEPNIFASARRETSALLDALNGNFVAPGPAGAPSRGRLDALPTGRNFYTFDPRTYPTPSAFAIGRNTANAMINRYIQEHGSWPRRMALTVWGTANMRSGGDDIAQALALMGAKPRWEETSKRVIGFEIVPLSELKRPRVDIVLRASGFFRDSFSEQIKLINTAAQAIGALNEPLDANPIREMNTNQKSESRVFTNAAGTYGGGLKELITRDDWLNDQELVETFINAGASVLDGSGNTTALTEQFRNMLAQTDVVALTQDAREFDLLGSDDFYEFEGGLAAAVKQIRGKEPEIYHSDTSSRQNIKIRTLQEEISLILHGRAINPKWLDAMKNHGARGAFDICRTVTALYGFAATTSAARSSHFEILFRHYVEDEHQRLFLEDANPQAYLSMLARFEQALERGFWQPKRNSTIDHLREIKAMAEERLKENIE